MSEQTSVSDSMVTRIKWKADLETRAVQTPSLPGTHLAHCFLSPGQVAPEGWGCVEQLEWLPSGPDSWQSWGSWQFSREGAQLRSLVLLCDSSLTSAVFSVVFGIYRA